MNRGYRYFDRIDRASAGETVLGYYTARYRHSTGAEWKTRIERGEVLLDGCATAPDARLARGQVLTYERAPWTEPLTPMTFDVLYEDEHLLAVDKPSGLPVLPGGHHLENTLLTLVRSRFDGKVPPSPLHRLGRATTGIVLFGRTEAASRAMTRAFAERRVTKLYRALVTGIGIADERSVDVPIGRVSYAPTGDVHAALPGGAPSQSVFRRIVEYPERGCSLVEVQILTGRPHQVRIHAAAIGHPLVGDPLYVTGGRPKPLVAGERAPLPGDCGYLLHAFRIEFAHPESGAWLAITSPPPSSLSVPAPARAEA